MKSKAVAKYLRGSAQKVRLVCALIKDKKASEAVAILENTHKKGARLLLAVLNSAIANAQVKKMNLDQLFVVNASADVGPSLKRLMTRSMGRADRIVKPTSHITVELSDEVLAGKA